MQELIKIAAQEIGVTEIAGDAHNDRILSYAKAAGFDNWYHSDEIPWCSVFLNYATQRAGLVRSQDGRAASWAEVGESIERPQPGDLALLVPSPGATHITHVGIYLGHSQDQRHIYLLGGNQSNQVNISPFPVDTLVGYRRLSRVGEAAAPVLQRGRRGDEVRALQDALKAVGIDVGPSDGDFGPKTETAVKELQRTQPDLPVTGVYDAATRAYLTQRLQQA
jgi:uncharacterized protein (TIGR02594 family)